MSHANVHVLHVPTPATPRGATLVGLLYGAFGALFKRTPAAAPSRAQEAAAVREMARELQHSDPGFAADLFAAAARHESKDD